MFRNILTISILLSQGFFSVDMITEHSVAATKSLRSFTSVSSRSDPSLSPEHGGEGRVRGRMSKKKAYKKLEKLNVSSTDSKD
jgi:hypothetical protein